MDTLLGTTLGGKYEIQAEIGRGGMGVVYRGYDVMLRRAVAIKVLPLEYTYDQQFVDRFRQEAVTAAGLHHTGIVTIHDVGQQGSWYYIVMQYLNGVTLDQWLANRGPMPIPMTAQVVRQIADALDYAHGAGIVHRDIKPSNIMIGPDGRATLMDFGLVRAGEGSKLTRSGMVVGTPEYMAPEQALGSPVDGRTDIYSLGVVIYRMLTGQVPFVRSNSMATVYAHVNEPPPPLRILRPEMPKSVEAVVLKALAKRPDDRYQDGARLVADFDLAASGKMPSGLRATVLPASSKSQPGVAPVSSKSQPGAQSPRPGAGKSPAPGASTRSSQPDAPPVLAQTSPRSAPITTNDAPAPGDQAATQALGQTSPPLVSRDATQVTRPAPVSGETRPAAMLTPGATVASRATPAPRRGLPLLPILGAVAGILILGVGGLALVRPRSAVTNQTPTTAPVIIETATSVPTPTAAAPVDTPSPLPLLTATPTPTPVPTLTGIPTATMTRTPSATPTGAATATITPTATPILTPTPSATPTTTRITVTPTRTPAPPTNTPALPTNTPAPPTNTPAPPTDTPRPPTDTPAPPTDTPAPPTDTPAPPTNTPIPDPTDTPPPTNTSVP
ncbi:protein kinase domain-containing protein [Candidatus Amarolinea aalborgensis]|uniref:serine/threonine-protein kinase n=1 Tax=Candidatus Amarolinea aalborgensis TaxID=2249329 RepID=UPI003BFA2646